MDVLSSEQCFFEQIMSLHLPFWSLFTSSINEYFDLHLWLYIAFHVLTQMSANSWAAETAIVPNFSFREIHRGRPTHLQTMTTEKLTLTKTVSSNLPAAIDGTTDRCSQADSLDSLLADLDANDEEEQPIQEDVPAIGASRKVPEELLHINPANGLTEIEVGQRRGEFGLNQMKEENRSHVKQFLSFFVGPVQFVMEVIIPIDFLEKSSTADSALIRQRVAWRLL